MPSLPPISIGGPYRIRSLILAVLGLIILPQAILLAWLMIQYSALQRTHREQQRANVATNVSASIDLELAQVLGIMQGTASDEAVLGSDLAAFAPLLRQPQIVRVWTFDRSGTAISGAPADARDPSPPLGRDILAKVFAGQWAVSDVYGRSPEDAHVILAVPGRRRDRPSFGLAVQLRIAHLSETFRRAQLDPSWPAAVLDRRGMFVARSLDADTRIGQPARPALIDVARSGASEGTFENVTYEGVRALNAFRRSAITGWTTVVAVPYDQMIGPMHRTVALLTLGGVIFIGVTVALATLLGRRIAQPIESLRNYAEALSTGMPAKLQRTNGIVELEEVQAALDTAIAESARLAALVRSSGDAIISTDRDGTIRTWNEGAEQLLGYCAFEIIGQNQRCLVPTDRIAEYEDQRLTLLRGCGLRCETQRRRKDGTVIDVLLASAPIRRMDGEIFGLSSIIHDITYRKEAEAHRHTLTRELAHRCKNQLAVVQSIAAQTAKQTASAEEFLAKFRGRMQGLAASHDLLTAGEWQGSPISECVRRQLETFVTLPSPQITLTGPDQTIDAVAAETLGLAIHELMTNAIKYGALSVPEGRVTIDWQIEDVDDDRHDRCLVFTWSEHDGPLVTTPSELGFGTTVIRQLVPSRLNGTVSLNYRPEGVQCRMRWPLDRVVRGIETAA